MKIFIWRRIKEASGRYHSEGGLVVVAKDEEEARLLSRSATGPVDRWIPKDNIEAGTKLLRDEAPDLVLDVPDDAQEIAWAFPDAGCC